MKMYSVTIDLSAGKGKEVVKETYAYSIPAESADQAKEHLEQLLHGAPALVLSNNTIWPLKFGATFKVKKAVLVKE